MPLEQLNSQASENSAPSEIFPVKSDGEREVSLKSSKIREEIGLQLGTKKD